MSPPVLEAWITSVHRTKITALLYLYRRLGSPRGLVTGAFSGGPLNPVTTFTSCFFLTSVLLSYLLCPPTLNSLL